METQVRTPQAIFVQPQRLLVPLFQRPYVWNEELQWEPLWKDLERVAERLLKAPLSSHSPHFLGAVVFQQLQNPASDLQQRTVIDGQQRLTTLQLLLDAVQAELTQAGATMAAKRLEQLTVNDEAYRRQEADRFKVWPTNRDRPAFNEVMKATPPIDYQKLEHRGSRVVKAHEYFARQCRQWLLAEGSDAVAAKAEAIERSARELLQIVVIDLTPNENAQEIFETLNARGAVLTAADLIKNFVFQRLMEQGADVEDAYGKYWKPFETAFWEEIVSVGRVKHQRSSVFLNHWLVARTGEEVVAREVFSGFKVYADFHAEQSMLELLQEIHRAAAIYRDFTEKAQNVDGPLDRVGLFTYRARTLESEVVKPVLLSLLDHPAGPLPATDVDLALDALESWLARRMLVRATAKSYNKLLADLVSVVRSSEPGKVADSVRGFFASQRSEVGYWPDDDEVRKELESLPIYRKLSRGRLRMVLESIEDHWRGWGAGKTSAAGMRIRRNTYAIEHLMPQSWLKHWPLNPGIPEGERDARIHQLGNLTLLTRKLNSTVSNGPWTGASGKAAHLQEKDVLLLNSRLLKDYKDRQWDEAGVDARTRVCIDAILEVWPVPAGHKVNIQKASTQSNLSVDVVDLLEAGLLSAGQTLFSRPGKYGGHQARILSDGQLEVNGRAFSSPSQAGIYVRNKPTNGWHFWRLAPAAKHSLDDLRTEYLGLASSDDPGTDQGEAVEEAGVA